MTSHTAWTRLTTGPFSAPRRIYEDAHDLARCRDCERLGAKDELTESVCPECVRDSGRVICDHCGRLVHGNVAKTEREIGFSGRMIEYHYCPPCVIELARERAS